MSTAIGADLIPVVRQQLTTCYVNTTKMNSDVFASSRSSDGCDRDFVSCQSELEEFRRSKKKQQQLQLQQRQQDDEVSNVELEHGYEIPGECLPCISPELPELLITETIHSSKISSPSSPSRSTSPSPTPVILVAHNVDRDFQLAEYELMRLRLSRIDEQDPTNTSLKSSSTKSSSSPSSSSTTTSSSSPSSSSSSAVELLHINSVNYKDFLDSSIDRDYVVALSQLENFRKQQEKNKTPPHTHTHTHE